MEARYRVYVGLCAAVVAFCGAFMLVELVRIPLPWYHPVDHRWTLEVQARSLAMGWYGRTLLASLFSGSGYLAAWFISGRVVIRRPRWYTVWASLAMVTLAFTITLYAWRLSGRVPTPAPLPSWYVPR